MVSGGQGFSFFLPCASFLLFTVPFFCVGRFAVVQYCSPIDAAKNIENMLILRVV